MLYLARISFLSRLQILTPTTFYSLLGQKGQFTLWPCPRRGFVGKISSYYCLKTKIENSSKKSLPVQQGVVQGTICPKDSLDRSGLAKSLILIHLCSQRPKSAWQFWWNLAGKRTCRKIFEGEMLIRTLSTTLLQIFCKIILNSEVIVKSIIDPDDNFLRNSFRSINGLTLRNLDLGINYKIWGQKTHNSKKLVLIIIP